MCRNDSPFVLSNSQKELLAGVWIQNIINILPRLQEFFNEVEMTLLYSKQFTIIKNQFVTNAWIHKIINIIPRLKQVHLSLLYNRCETGTADLRRWRKLFPRLTSTTNSWKQRYNPEGPQALANFKTFLNSCRHRRARTASSNSIGGLPTSCSLQQGYTCQF